MRGIDPRLLDLSILDTFQGSRNEEGYPHGKGRASFRTGYLYDGDWSLGKFHGLGTLSFPDGSVYEGELHEGTITGHGKFSYVDGSVYEGDVLNGVRHGNGTYVADSPLGPGIRMRYEGSWNDGSRTGSGVLMYDSRSGLDGPHYAGEFVNDVFHGHGKAVYSSGSWYDGSWKNGEKDGHGRMSWEPVQEEYVGEWKKNVPEGHGEYTWYASGNRYVGDFVGGLREGDGRFFYADGSQYIGQWKNNMKDGQGHSIDSAGSVKQGYFVEDRWMSATEVAGAPLTNGSFRIHANLSDVLAAEVASSGIPEETLTQTILDTLFRRIKAVRFCFDAARSPGSDVISLHSFWVVVQQFVPSVFGVLSLAEIDEIFFIAVKSSFHTKLAGGIKDLHSPSNEMRFRDFCESLIRCAVAFGHPDDRLENKLDSLLLELESRVLPPGPPKEQRPKSAASSANGSIASSSASKSDTHFKTPLPSSLKPVFEDSVFKEFQEEQLLSLRTLYDSLVLKRRRSTSSRVPPMFAPLHEAEEGGAAALKNAKTNDSVILVRDFLQLLSDKSVIGANLRLTDVVDLFPQTGKLVVERRLIFPEFLRSIEKCASKKKMAVADFCATLLANSALR
eukprot:ANDGO_01520.mRNA.1 Phosphatidylinositol 4-phosphate 5-kinase 6